MKKMIQLKYVPICVCSLCHLIERANNGEPVLDTNWMSVGCPPMASLNEIKAIAENIEKKMFPSFCQIIS
jgi:hypothetical protein